LGRKVSSRRDLPGLFSAPKQKDPYPKDPVPGLDDVYDFVPKCHLGVDDSYEMYIRDALAGRLYFVALLLCVYVSLSLNDKNYLVVNFTFARPSTSSRKYTIVSSSSG